MEIFILSVVFNDNDYGDIIIDADSIENAIYKAKKYRNVKTVVSFKKISTSTNKQKQL